MPRKPATPSCPSCGTTAGLVFIEKFGNAMCRCTRCHFEWKACAAVRSDGLRCVNKPTKSGRCRGHEGIEVALDEIKDVKPYDGPTSIIALLPASMRRIADDALNSPKSLLSNKENLAILQAFLASELENLGTAGAAEWQMLCEMVEQAKAKGIEAIAVSELEPIASIGSDVGETVAKIRGIMDQQSRLRKTEAQNMQIAMNMMTHSQVLDLIGELGEIIKSEVQDIEVRKRIEARLARLVS